MDEDRFRKVCFKAGMPIEYRQRGGVILCTLCAVDFDNEVVRLLPIDTDEWEPDEFWTSIKFIDLPRKETMKLIRNSK